MGLGAGGGEGGGEGHGKGQGRGDNGCLAGACCLIFVVVVLVLGLFGMEVAKIAMGAIYVDDCPMQKFIPVYLMVGGCAPVLLGFLSSFKKKEDEDIFESEGIKKMRVVFEIIGAIGFLFNFSWLICGSVWVFGNYSDVMDGCGGSSDCCDKDLMKFALAVTIIDWILYAFILIVLCFLCAVICSGFICGKEKVGP